MWFSPWIGSCGFKRIRGSIALARVVQKQAYNSIRGKDTLRHVCWDRQRIFISAAGIWRRSGLLPLHSSCHIANENNPKMPAWLLRVTEENRNNWFREVDANPFLTVWIKSHLVKCILILDGHSHYLRSSPSPFSSSVRFSGQQPDEAQLKRKGTLSPIQWNCNGIGSSLKSRQTGNSRHSVILLTLRVFMCHQELHQKYSE